MLIFGPRPPRLCTSERPCMRFDLMTTSTVEVSATRHAPLADVEPEGSLRIICPTYWYPKGVTDTHATYVHDINRHLVRRGHRVTVVTPGNTSMPATEQFDGVDVVRFPMELPL